MIGRPALLRLVPVLLAVHNLEEALFMRAALPHVAARVPPALRDVLRGYSPGLATALAVNLPFSVHLLRRARRERWVGGRTLPALLPAALLFHGPGLLALLAAAGWLAHRL